MESILRTISAVKLGRKYGVKGDTSVKYRVMLEQLGIIGRSNGTSYIAKSELPATSQQIVQLYAKKYWTDSIISIFEDAKSTIQELSDEMGEWRDNMSDSEGLMAADKYELVDEAASILENVTSGLDCLDINTEIEVTYILY